MSDPHKISAPVLNQDKSRVLANITVFGALAVRRLDGADITPNGKKAKALLAMLALAPTGRRSRAWLQDKLWSDKEQSLGRGSLRQELSALRQHLKGHGVDVITASKDDIVINSSVLHIDAFSITPPDHFELLEGLDVGDEEFEIWLSEERAFWYKKLDEKRRPVAATRSGDPSSINTVETRQGAIVPYLELAPFQTIGDNPELKIFTAGLNSELGTVLGAIAGSFRLIDPFFNKVQNADYRLDGATQLDGTLRVHARIVSLQDGSIIWGDRFDVGIGLGFRAREALSRRIAEAIQRALTDGHWVDIVTKSAPDTRAWELFQRGRVQEGFGKKPALSKAINFYRHAIELDPDFIEAKIALGFCLIDGIRLCWHRDPDSAHEEVKEICREILISAPTNHFGIALSAFNLCLMGEFDEAKHRMLSLVSQAPESPEMTAYLGAVYGYCGDIPQEIRLYRHALTLTKHPPIWIRTNLALSLLMLNRPTADDSSITEAAEIIERLLSEDNENMRAFIADVVIKVRSGDLDAAKASAKAIRQLDSDFNASRWRAVRFFADTSLHARITRDLQAVGL